MFKKLFKKNTETKVKITWKWIDEEETITEVTTSKAVLFLNADPCIEVISVERV